MITFQHSQVHLVAPRASGSVGLPDKERHPSDLAERP